MIYRDDDAARVERAKLLIDEIASLEHQKVAQATTDQRLEAARRELLALQPPTTAPVAPTGPGLLAHVVVFSAAASAAYLGYTLLI